ncbi:tetratricopeptide repeat protein [candidate division KSB1 bacterium]|nr:tetratricopeptide repeat protein [candidate division KSB1 bacterium]
MKQSKLVIWLLAGIFLWIGVHGAYAQSAENQAFMYAKKLYDEGMFSLAASQFKNFIEEHPTSSQAPEALFMAGEAYFKLEKYNEAQQAYLEMTIRYSEAHRVDEAQMKIGECYKAVNDYAKAASAYQRVKVFYPKSTFAPPAIIEAARMFGLAGDFPAAIRTYYAYLDEYPEASNAFQIKLELLDILIKKGELKRALSESEKLIAGAYQKEDKAHARYFKGLIQEEIGQIQGAQDEYHAVIEGSANRDLQAKANLRLGTIYRLKGEWQRSNDFFMKSLASRGSEQVQAETYLMLGENYFDLHSYAEAQSFYAKLIDAAKPDPVIYFKALYKSGLSYKNLADYKNANQYFLRLIKEGQSGQNEVADYLEHAYLEVARNYLLLKSVAQAIIHFRTYLERYPQSQLVDRIHYRIAEIHEREMGSPEKAIRLYDRFIERFPNSVYIDDAQLGIARCYEQLGQYGRAIKEYHHFLSAYPGGADYKQTAQRVEFLQKFAIDDQTKALYGFSDLMNEVITGRSQGWLYYRLAEINFEHIHNYSSALRFYRSSMTSGVPSDLNDKINFRIAQSYELLAQTALDSNALDRHDTLIDSARMNYQLVNDQYANSPWADDACIALIELRARDRQSPASRSDIAIQYFQALGKYPASDNKDLMLLRLGEVLIGESSPATDSIGTAKQYFQQLLSGYPNSAYRGEARFMLGIYHYQARDYFAANDAFEAYIANFPNGAFIVRAFNLLAKMEYDQENYEQSIEHYKHIITNYHYSQAADSAALALGDLYFKKNDMQSALKHYLAIEAKLSKISWLAQENMDSGVLDLDEVIFKLASVYEQAGEHSLAKQQYQKYIKMSPNGRYVPEALLALGRITAADSQHDSDLALSYYQRLKDEFPNQKFGYDASVKVADLLFEEGKYQEAQAEYARAVGFAESDVQQEYPQAQSIVCSYRSGQIAAGDREQEKFRKRFGGIDVYLAQFDYEKGEYYLNSKSFSNAEKLFSQIRSKYKRTEFAPKAELSLGKLYTILNKDEKALDILTAIPQKYPDSEVTAIAFINLGDYYIGEQQVPNAIAMYKKALDHPRIGTSKPMTMKKLISAYELYAMTDQQLSLIKDFIQLYPQDESVFDMKFKIGSIYKQSKEYDKAIAAYEALLEEANPENEAEVQFFLAECYELQGKFEQAISEFLKVKYVAKQTKLPFGTSAQYRAALLYKKKGQYEEAKQLLDKIVKSRGLADDFGRFANDQLSEIERLQATDDVNRR